MVRYPCDVVMSFHPIPKQDLFRSGGGPHRVYIDKMSKNKQEHVYQMKGEMKRSIMDGLLGRKVEDDSRD